ncbi:hypothetical protein M433DRAFT_157500 [Acidomyces richmondensis BFW]|nr:hypothetical protein M433DRAFT_157500 [Acidomyces richmondensis BFW]
MSMIYITPFLLPQLNSLDSVVESDGLSVLRPGESAPKRREESNGNQDRDED